MFCCFDFFHYLCILKALPWSLPHTAHEVLRPGFPSKAPGGSSIVTLYAAMGVVSAIKKRSPTMVRYRRILT